MKGIVAVLICASLVGCAGDARGPGASVAAPVDDGLPPGDRVTAEPLADVVVWDPTRENGRPDGPVLTTVPATVPVWDERDVVLAPLEVLFAADSTRDQLVLAMENGEQMIEAFEKAAASPNVPADLELRVDDAKPSPSIVCDDTGISTPCAYAKYILITGDQYATNFLNAYFVKQDGRWKVSMRSVCELIASQLVTCPVDLPPPPGEIRMREEAASKLPASSSTVASGG